MGCDTCSANEAIILRLGHDLNDSHKKYAELQAQFNTHKLKSKARVTQLRQQLTELTQVCVNGNDDHDNESTSSPDVALLARLQLKIDDCQGTISDYASQLDSLRAELAEKDTKISDYVIKIKALENDTAAYDNGAFIDTTPTRPEFDDAVVSRLLTEKQSEILQMKNDLLERERRLIDVEESWRESQQLLEAKTKAVQILRQENIDLQEALATATTNATSSTELPQPIPMDTYSEDSANDTDSESTSLTHPQNRPKPGRAVATVFPNNAQPYEKADTNSGPPTPTLDSPQVLPELNVDFNVPVIPFEEAEAAVPSTSALPVGSGDNTLERQKKKVRFDLPPESPSETELDTEYEDHDEQIEYYKQLSTDLYQRLQSAMSITTELREKLDDTNNRVERNVLTEKLFNAQIEQLTNEIEEVRREGRNAVLKAKAQAQLRITELQEASEVKTAEIDSLSRMLSDLQAKLEQHEIDATNQHFMVETLKTENLHLLARATETQDEELTLAAQLTEAQSTAETLLQQKRDILEDVEQLKNALDTSQQLIDDMEADLEASRNEQVQMREQMSALRESMDSKVWETMTQQEVEHKRSALKGKAYDVKLRQLTEQNAQLTQDVNVARMKTKAYEAKLRVLEREAQETKNLLDLKQDELVVNEEKQQRLEAELQTLNKETERQIVKIDQLTADITSMKFELEEAKRARDAIVEEKQEIENEIQDLWQRETNHKRTIAELESDNKRLTEERADFRQQCKDLILSENELTNAVAQFKTTITRQDSEKSLLTERVRTLEKSSSEHQMQLADELEQTRGVVREMTSRNEELTKKLSHLETTVTDLKEDKRIVHEQLATAVAEQQSLNHQLPILNQQLESTVNENIALKDQMNSRNDQMHQQLELDLREKSDAETKLTELNNNLSEVNNQLNISINRVNELEASSSSLEAENAALKRQLDNYNRQLTENQQRIAFLEYEMQDVSKVQQSTMERNDNDVNEQQHQLVLLTQQLATAKQELVQVKAAGVESEQHAKELKVRLQHFEKSQQSPAVPSVDTSAVTDLQEQIVDLQQELLNYKVQVEQAHSARLVGEQRAGELQKKLDEMMSDFDTLESQVLTTEVSEGQLNENVDEVLIRSSEDQVSQTDVSVQFTLLTSHQETVCIEPTSTKSSSEDRVSQTDVADRVTLVTPHQETVSLEPTSTDNDQDSEPTPSTPSPELSIAQAQRSAELMNELTEQQAVNDDLENTIIGLNAELSALSVKLKKSEEDRANCVDTIKTLQSSVEQFARERSEIMKRLTQSGRSLDDTSSTRKNEQKAQELTEENARLLETITTISAELNSAQRKNMELSRQLSELTAESHDTFERRSPSVEPENMDSSPDDTGDNNDLDAVYERLEQYEHELEEKSEQLMICRSDLSDLSMQHKDVVEVLRSETDALRCLMDRQQQEAETTIQQLRDDNDALTNKAVTIETECAKANDLVFHLRQQVADLETANAEVAAQLESRTRALDLLRGENEQLMQQMEGDEMDMSEIRERASTAQAFLQENVALKQEIQQLSVKVKDEQSVIDQNTEELRAVHGELETQRQEFEHRATALEERLRQAEQDCQIKSEELVNRTQQANEAEQSLTDRQQEIGSLEARCDELSYQLAELSKQREDAEEERAKSAECEHDLEVLQQIITDLETANSELQTAIEIQEKEVNDTRSNLMQTEEALSELKQAETNSSNLQAQLLVTEQRISIKEEELSQAAFKEQSLSADIDKLSAELSSIKGSYSEATERLQSCEADLEDANKTIQTLRSSLTEKSKVLEHSIVDLNRELEETKEQLLDQERQAMDSETQLMQTLSELRSNKAVVDELTSNNNTLKKCLTEKEGAFDELNQNLHSTESKLNEYDELMKKKTEEYDTLHQTYSKLREQCQSLVASRDADSATLKSQIEHYEEQLNNLRQQASRVPEIEQLLNATNTAMNDRQASMSENIERLSEENAALQRQMQVSQNTIEALESTTKDLCKNIDITEKQRFEAEKQADEIKRQLKLEQEETSEWKQKLADVMNKLASVESELSEVKTQKSVQEQMLEEKTSAFNDLQNNFTSLSNQLEACAGAESYLQSETSSLATQLEDVKKESDALKKEKEELTQRENELISQCQVFTSELQSLKATINELSEANEAATETAFNATSEINTLKIRISELEEINQQVVDEKQQAVNQLAVIQSQLQAKDNELCSMQEQLTAVQSECDMRLNAIDSTATENNELKLHIQKMEQLTQQVEVPQGETAPVTHAHEELGSNLQSQLSAKDEELALTHQKLTTLQSEFNAKLAEMEQTVDDYKTKIDESMEATLRNREKSISEHLQKIDELKSQIDDRDTMLELKTSEITQLQSTCSNLQIRLDQVNDYKQVLNDEDSREAQPNNSAIDTLTTSCARLTEERARMSSDQKTLCEEIVKLNDIITTLKGKREADHIVISGLEKSIDELIAENDRLTSFAEYIETLKGDNTELLDKVAALEEESQLLRHCLNNVRKNAFQMAEQLGARATDADEANKAREELDRAKEEFLKLNDVIEEMMQKHEHDQDIINQLMSEVRSLEEDNDIMRIRLDEAESKLFESHSSLTSAKAEKESLTTTYTTLVGHYQQLQASYTMLYEQMSQTQQEQHQEPLVEDAVQQHVIADLAAPPMSSNFADACIQTDETQEDWCALVDRVTETEDELSSWKSNFLYLTSDAINEVQSLKQYAKSIKGFIRTEQDSWTKMIQKTSEMYVKRTQQIYKDMEREQATLSKANGGLRAECDAAMNELDEVKADLEEYKSSYDWLTNENETLQTALDAKKVEYQQLKEQNQKTKQSLETLKIENVELHSQINALTAEKNSLEVTLDSSRASEELMQAELTRTRRESISRESTASVDQHDNNEDDGRNMRIKDLEAIVDQMQTKIDNQHTELTDCKEQYEQEISDLLYNMEKLRCCVDEATERGDENAERVNEYTMSWKWLRQQIADVIDIDEQGLTDGDLINRLRNTNADSPKTDSSEDFEQQLNAINEDLEMATSMNEDLKNKLKSLKQKQEEDVQKMQITEQELRQNTLDLQCENDSLKLTNQTHVKLIEEIQFELAAKETIAAKLQEEKQALETRVDEFANEILRLKMTLEEQKLNSSKSIEEFQRSASDDTAVLEETMKAMREETENWTIRYSELQAKKEHYRQQCETLQATIQKLESGLQSKEEHLETRVDEFSNEILRLKMSLEEQKLNSSKSSEEFQRSASDDTAVLDETMKALREESENWTIRFSELQAKEEHYRQQCATLQATIQTLQSGLQSKEEHLETRVDEFANEILRLKMSLEEQKLNSSKSIEEFQRSASDDTAVLDETMKALREESANWKSRFTELQAKEEHYRQQCETLQATIQTLESSLQTKEEHLTLVKQAAELNEQELNTTIESVRKEGLQLQSQVMEMSVQITKLQNNNEDLHNKVKHIDDINDELYQNKDAVANANEIKQRYEQAEYDRRLMKVDLDRAMKENHELRTEMKKFDAVKEKMEDLMLLKSSEDGSHAVIEDQLYDDINKLELQLKESNTENERLTEQVDQLNELLSAANCTLMSTRKDSWEVRAQLLDLQTENQRLKEHLHAVNAQERETADRIEYCLEQMADTASSSDPDESIKLRSLANQVATLNKQLDISRAEMDAVMDQLQQTQSSNISLQTFIQQQEQRHHDFINKQDQEERVRQLKDHQQHEVLQMKHEMEQVAETQRLANDQSTTEELTRLREENAELTEQLQQTQQAIVDLRRKAQGKDSDSQLAEVQQARDDAIREIGMLKEKVARFERNQENVEQKLAERDGLLGRVMELEASEQTMKREKQQLEMQKRSSQDAVAELQASLEASNEQVENMKESVSNLTAQVTTVTSRELIRVEELQKRLEVVSSKLTETEASKSSLEQLIRERDTEIARLHTTDNDWFDDEDSQLVGLSVSNPLLAHMAPSTSTISSTGLLIDDSQSEDPLEGRLRISLTSGLRMNAENQRNYCIQRIRRLRTWLRRQLNRRRSSNLTFVMRMSLVAYVLWVHFYVLRCYFA